MEEIQQFEIDPYNGFMVYAGTDICGDAETGVKYVRYEDHLEVVRKLQEQLSSE